MTRSSSEVRCPRETGEARRLTVGENDVQVMVRAFGGHAFVGLGTFENETDDS